RAAPAAVDPLRRDVPAERRRRRHPRAHAAQPHGLLRERHPHRALRARAGLARAGGGAGVRAGGAGGGGAGGVAAAEQGGLMGPSPRRVALWIGFALALLAVPVGALMHRSKQAGTLPQYGDVPAFKLVDQDGLPFGSDELRGQPYVADFIFTSCASACPRL